MAASIKLKPINQQVIVITGASSGIGLTTARMAAERGARLVLAARNEEALAQLVQEINSKDGKDPTNQPRAVSVAADVGKEEDVRWVAQLAAEKFGGFDTWVNNAGVSIYGHIKDIPNEDNRRLFETNFWGVVYGSQAAAEHLRKRGGGAIINVGSTVSDRSIPLQGMYSASKFAVKGFTDALRMELEEEGAPVSVTLIKPAAIDTPYLEHAKSYLPEGREPSFPPPVYAPETVAEAILHAAQNVARDIHVGGGSKMFSVMEKMAPRLTDRYMERALFKQQQRPARGRQSEGLYAHGRGMMERGGYGEDGHVMESSMYTKASTHPLVAGALIGVAGAAVAALLVGTRREEPTWRDLPGRVNRRARDWWGA